MKHTGRTRLGLHALQGCAALCGAVVQAGGFPKEGMLAPFRPLGDAGSRYVDSISVTRRLLPVHAVQQQP
ncbi:hypothetical protein [Azohydromonas lata]|uniref:Uncharacterized protein n=1 Tax=Azohydromonas lata TaxID=45677 RepID=A0ABU5IS10_9BURK|nr:hypothetical protein [Azohydromonas lata]MDZ5461679.1 hypothetical protein [Azohydromonas lata]